MERFRLDVGSQNLCIVKDMDTGLVCTFEKFRFDETLKIRYIPEDDLSLAVRVMKELRLWIMKNHQEKLANLQLDGNATSQNKRGGSRSGAGRKSQGKKKLSVRLCPEVYEKIEKISDQYNMTKTEVVEMALKLTQKL